MLAVLVQKLGCKTGGNQNIIDDDICFLGQTKHVLFTKLAGPFVRLYPRTKQSKIRGGKSIIAAKNYQSESRSPLVRLPYMYVLRRVYSAKRPKVWNVRFSRVNSNSASNGKNASSSRNVSNMRISGTKRRPAKYQQQRGCSNRRDASKGGDTCKSTGANSIMQWDPNETIHQVPQYSGSRTNRKITDSNSSRGARNRREASDVNKMRDTAATAETPWRNPSDRVDGSGDTDVNSRRNVCSGRDTCNSKKSTTVPGSRMPRQQGCLATVGKPARARCSQKYRKAMQQSRKAKNSRDACNSRGTSNCREASSKRGGKCSTDYGREVSKKSWKCQKNIFKKGKPRPFFFSLLDHRLLEVYCSLPDN